MKIKIFIFCLLVVFSYADQENNDKKALEFTLKKQEIPQGHILVKLSEKEKQQGWENPGYVPQQILENFCSATKINKKNIVRLYSLSLQGKTDQAGYMVFKFSDKKLLETHLEKVLKIVIGWVFIYTYNEHLILFWSHDNESSPMLQKWAGRVVKRFKNDDKVTLFFRGKRYIPPVF